MNKNEKLPSDHQHETPVEQVPFVNEECGDTLWDVVLKEQEEKLQKIVAPVSKPINKSTPENNKI